MSTVTGPMQHAGYVARYSHTELVESGHTELTLTPPLTARPFACRYHPQCVCVCARGWVGEGESGGAAAGVRGLGVYHSLYRASTEPLPSLYRASTEPLLLVGWML